MLKIIIITNSFEPQNGRIIKEVEWEGKAIHDYLPPLDAPVVALNQKQVTDFSIIPHDGSEILISNKQEASAIVSWVSGLLYGAFAGGVATAATMTAITVASYVVAGAVLYAGSMLLSSVMGPKKPNFNSGTSSIESSPTYSWNQATTMPRAGSPIPVLYGKMQTSGSIVQRRIEYVGDDEYLYLQLALCMGEIRDIYDGNIFINDEVITNYENAEFRFSNGTFDQEVMEYFGDVESPNNFSTTLENSPIIRETNGDAVQALRLFIQFPNGIYYQNDKGGLDARSVEFKIEYKRTTDTKWTTHQSYRRGIVGWEYEHTAWVDGDNDYSYKEYIWSPYSSVKNYRHTGNKRAVYRTDYFDTWVFSGNKTSAINREVRIDGLAGDKYEVRVTRLTAVSTNPRLQTTSNWSGMGEIIKDDLAYPTVALLGLRVKATGQLSGDVNVKTLISRKRIAIYDQNGDFFGNMESDNPAWAFWDVLTNQQYGYGLPYAQIDFQKIKEWALWCDELVSNGLSLREPRCRFNGIFDYEGSIWDALQQIASAGRAAPIIKGTKYSVVVDKETPTTQMFNMGNIIQGSLKVTYLGQENMASEVEVQFVNAAKDYTNDTLTVVVPEWYNTDEIPQKTTINQMGVTDASHAYRVGRYHLNSNKHVRRMVEFEASTEALECEAGDVIEVSHDVPAWGRSGRLVSATSTTLTLDEDVELLDGREYKIKVRYQDDTTVERDVVFSGTQTTTTLTVATMDTVPSQYDIYSLIEKSNEYMKFRITSITRKSDHTRKITGIEYNESIVKDDITILPSESYSEIQLTPSIGDIEITEHLEKRNDGTIIPYINFKWNVIKASTFYGNKYAIYVSRDDGETYQKLTGDLTTTSYSHAAIDLTEGKKYFFKVSGKTLGTDYQALKDIIPIPYRYFGKLAPPEDVTGFQAKQNGNFIDFKWNHTADVDRKGYEIRKGVTWQTAKPIEEIISTSSYTVQAEFNGTYEYLIKAIDTSGIYSENATSTWITLANVEEKANAILDQNESPDWSGEKEHFYKVGADLINYSSLLDTDIPSETDLNVTDYDGARPLVVSYTTEAIDTLKIGETSTRIIESFIATIYNITDLELFARTDITYPNDTDVAVSALINSDIYITYSNDGVDYGEWQGYFGVVSENFRYAKIKIEFVFNIANTRVVLSSLRSMLDVPDIVLEIPNFTVGATGEDIVYADYGKDFYLQTFVRATVLDGGRNITPDITGKSLSGFHIDLYNSADAKTSGVVDLVISGY